MMQRLRWAYEVAEREPLRMTRRVAMSPGNEERFTSKCYRAHTRISHYENRTSQAERVLVQTLGERNFLTLVEESKIAGS